MVFVVFERAESTKNGYFGEFDLGSSHPSRSKGMVYPHFGSCTKNMGLFFIPQKGFFRSSYPPSVSSEHIPHRLDCNPIRRGLRGVVLLISCYKEPWLDFEEQVEATGENRFG